ncbi:hypothetical protein Misp03_80970 [Microbispora sp. NBRC 16548]|nr:hypothetical protein Misp03_80970 [Microbispora sp. NBRC 16548]
MRFVSAVLGAIAAGAAGSYVSEWLTARRAVKAAEAAAVAEEGTRRAALAATREVVSTGESVAGLLRPERGVVMFAGRVEELKALTGWCEDEAACPVRLLTGQGGVGKTRLALHLAESLPFMDWECQQVRPGQEVAAVRAAGQADQRVLLLVDYAETRPELPAMLAEVARLEATGDAGRLRVLLLARQAGEWWTELDTESDAVRALVARTPVLELAPALDADRSDLQVIEEALPFFAAARGRPVPRMSFTVTSAERLPVLVLHAAALVAVLDEEQGTAGGRAAADLGVLDRLLGHERRLWDKTARRAGVGVALAVLQQVVAAVALLLDAQDHDEDAVRAVVRRVPDLARADDARVGAVVRWLRQVYPGGGERVEALRPDLLAERHAVHELIANSLLRRACATDLTERQAVQMLTVLVRACAHHDQGSRLIEQVLRQDLTGLAAAAIVVAVQTGPRLGDLFAHVLEDAPAAVADLQQIAEMVPYPTVALAAAAVAVTRRVRDLLPVGIDQTQIAEWSSKFATVLAQVGRREEALEAVTEAVTVYRSLAETRPDAFQPDLAMALNNQATCLSNLGQREKALTAIEEAIKLYRTLAKTRPDAFLPDLAMALNNQATCLSDLGQRKEALTVIEEAVQIRRTLAKTRPDAFQPSLASSLNNQATCLSDLGQRKEALTAIEEAIKLYRTLAKTRPDAFQPELAMALNNQAICLSYLGQQEKALTAIEEAIKLYRTLAKTRPDAFQPSLASSLNNQATYLSNLGQQEEALTAIEEAIKLYRTLAKIHPDAFLPDLAMALNNQANCLSRLGKRKEALTVIEEAVQIRRTLAKTRPDAFQPDLANSLNNQAACLSNLGQQEKALTAIQEAIKLYRTLAKIHPDAFLPDLAMALNNQATCLSNLGKREKALTAIQEAIKLYHTLAKTHPNAYLPNLARTLAVQGKILLQNSNAVEAAPFLLESLKVALEAELEELLPPVAGLLCEAYKQDPEGVARVWREISESDLPGWVTDI